jgi:hypothetical protein
MGYMYNICVSRIAAQGGCIACIVLGTEFSGRFCLSVCLSVCLP